MFPIRDHNPSRTAPIVTTALIAINVVVFLMTLPYFGSERALMAFYSDWALIPAKVIQTGDLTPVFTSMFLHGGFMHIIGNMLFLWIFGDNMEDAFGHVGFLLFYIACGVGAAAIHIASAPYSTVPTVGASGAIAGVLGGYLLLYPRARVDVLIFLFVFVTVISLPAWFMLGFWFLLQLLNSAAADPNMGGVAYWAHTGGFLFGLLFTFPIWLKRGHLGHWRETEARPPYPQASYKRISRTEVPVVRRRRR